MMPIIASGRAGCLLADLHVLGQAEVEAALLNFLLHSFCNWAVESCCRADRGVPYEGRQKHSVEQALLG